MSEISVEEEASFEYEMNVKERFADYAVYFYNRKLVGVPIDDLICQACKEGDIELVKWVCREYDLSVNGLEREGDGYDVNMDTPFTIACERNHIELVRYFIENFDDEHSFIYEYTKIAVKMACKNNNIDMIQFLVNSFKLTKDDLSEHPQFIDQLTFDDMNEAASDVLGPKSAAKLS